MNRQEELIERANFFILLKTLLRRIPFPDGTCNYFYNHCSVCLFSQIKIACLGNSPIFRFLNEKRSS